MEGKFYTDKLSGLIVAGVLALVVLFGAGSVIETLDAEEVMVIQNAFTGDLALHTTPGPKLQMFGTITKYPRRSIHEFEKQMRFNDGGHATMKGSIQYEMPLDTENLTNIHLKFGSPQAVAAQLVETVVVKSIYMTGPLMSSKESYAEKRNQLIHYVEDQVSRGVYQTSQKDVRVKDPITGVDKTATLVDIVLDENGTPKRQEAAVLQEFGIKSFNFSIAQLEYDNQVEAQIQSQQKITMEVQTAIADSKKAEQNAITVEQQGKAQAAKAKWDQEVIKAKFVTEAQQKLEVAILDAQAAAQNKRATILLGEGEAEKQRLIKQANNNLDQKLDAYKEVNFRYADAISKYTGNWVPTVVMAGAGGAGGQNGAAALIEMLSVKTAKDLALDMSIEKK